VTATTQIREINQEKVYEDTLCITEENTYSNQINPIKLADIGWCNDYKLSKLLAYQTMGLIEGSIKVD
jgi:hypothetical protein